MRILGESLIRARGEAEKTCTGRSVRKVIGEAPFA